MTFSKKNHSTELFKIFFSLLTLSTAFLQKASGPGKNKSLFCYSNHLPFTNSMDRFKIIYQSLIKGRQITKYRSIKTGLTVTHIDVEGPLVKGYFTLATEESSNDGLPHTLEHLIFLGSELYPYKGILDLVANQCFAQGTNAWTAVDHTAYTVETAGWEGFLILLPIYLDHILFPTLTEEAFVTEVHHINGEGDDSGVVYCEMQARENDADSRLEHAIQKYAFANTCGYKWETGGIMENLRTTCTNERVKSFHRKFYRPENLDVIICGSISITDYLDSLVPIDDRASKIDYSEYAKPWSSPVELFSISATHRVPFPAKVNDGGKVSITWNGPSIYNQKEWEAHHLLWDYLITSSASPLIKGLVDIEVPYCSKISYSSDEYPKSLFTAIFKGTKPETEMDVKIKVLEILRAVHKNGLDMERMYNIIKNEICNLHDTLEDDPIEVLADKVILDHLYGGDDNVILENYTDIFNVLKFIQSETEAFWKNILNYYINQPNLNIVAYPCEKTMSSLELDEKERIADQKNNLKPEGLLKKKQILEDAVMYNDRDFDDDVLDRLPRPVLDNLRFHTVITKAYLESGIYTHQISSDFCRFFLTFSTEQLTPDEKNLLCLYAGLFCDTPMKTDSGLLSYEEVIKKKEKILLKASCNVGGTDVESCSELVTMEFKFLVVDYSECLTFIKNLMVNRVFSENRVQTFI